MNTYERFYTESLYPIQDGVIKAIKSIPTPFYLTGGTALSRGYFNHRFSDDLDFFVNNAPDFSDLAGVLIEAVRTRYRVTSEVEAHDYLQIHAHADAVSLKIDLVNDIASRVGELLDHPGLGRIDNLHNILSNKISALYRYEAKDVVDILWICRNISFNWGEIVSQAREKEAGVEPSLISEIIRGIPDGELQNIKWTVAPDYPAMRADLERISMDILEGTDNSLAG